jgi:transposase
VLDHLISHIRRVRPTLYRTRDFFLLHDNAPAHSAAMIRQFLAQKQVATSHQPPYSPDLAPADYFLFPKVKLQLKDAVFDTVQEIQKAVTDKLQAIPAKDFSNAMKKLEIRANQCIASNGSYFE